MQLDYKQKYNGQYILSKIDIEKIATDVLNEFSSVLPKKKKIKSSNTKKRASK